MLFLPRTQNHIGRIASGCYRTLYEAGQLLGALLLTCIEHAIFGPMRQVQRWVDGRVEACYYHSPEIDRWLELAEVARGMAVYYEHRAREAAWEKMEELR